MSNIGIIGIIPIFVNAGAAVLPTVMAAMASVAMVVLKPRELAGLLRRRSVRIGILAVVVVIGLGIATWRLVSAPKPHTTQHGSIATTTRYDWAKVAKEVIAQQQIRQKSVATAAAPPDQSTPAISTIERTASALPPVKLAALWSYNPEDTMFLGVPAIFEDRIFVAGSQADLGGYTGLLACLDRETGRLLWQVTETAGEPLRPFFSSPAVTQDGKYLVIGQGLHEDRDCSLLCFDTAAGKLRWAVKTPLHIESSPTIFGDIAVVGAGAVEGRNGKPVGDPGYCLAVRISDGKELWRQPVNDPESSPAIDENGVVYIGSGFNGNAVVALRSESDEELHTKGLERLVWRTAVAQPIPGPITLVGNMVIAGGGNSDLVHSNRDARGLVVAMNRATGAILWQTEFDDAVLGRIGYQGRMLVCPVRTGEVTALNIKDGSTLWKTPISGNAPVLGGCAIAGSRVYAVSSDGYLAILDAEDGHVLEKIYLNDQGKPGMGLTLSTPCIVGERILVGSETGGLKCLGGSGWPQ